jgi:haloacetate dehalogenase
MWHRIAPQLAQTHRVILMDLRGYGWSSAPRGDAAHATYSKRAMGMDVVRVMEELGHVHFAVVGHDRGARVGYRLALDHPGRVERLALLDILPTFHVWALMRSGAIPQPIGATSPNPIRSPKTRSAAIPSPISKG